MAPCSRICTSSSSTVTPHLVRRYIGATTGRSHYVSLQFYHFPSTTIISVTALTMYKLFALIYLLFSVHGTATSQEQNRPHKLLRRDVCDGIDDTPVLYHRYLSDICRPKYEPSSEGVCDHIDYQTNSCLAFCQLSTRFLYGREFPLGVWCDGPPCEIAEFTKTLTWSIDMNPNFEKGLNDGISGGWQSKLTSDVGPRKMALEKPLKDGQCGYWSWVSIERTVW